MFLSVIPHKPLDWIPRSSTDEAMEFGPRRQQMFESIPRRNPRDPIGLVFSPLRDGAGRPQQPGYVLQVRDELGVEA